MAGVSAKKLKLSSAKEDLDELKQDLARKLATLDLDEFKQGLKSCLSIPCRCLSFTAANAADKDQSYSFCQAYCGTAVREDPRTRKKEEYGFGSFFDDGVELLIYFTKGNYESSSQEELILFQRLLDFIKNNDNREQLYRLLYDSEMTERHLAVPVAHHLLSKLSLVSSFTVDEGYQRKPDGIERQECPCGCGESFEGEGVFGDTEFGHPKVWHGNTDILANGHSVICSVIGQRDGTDSRERSSVQVKKDVEKNTGQKMNQLIAQTVCFSFLQNSRNTQFINKFVPALGLYTNYVIIILYDPHNDKLVQSTAINLIDTTKQKVRLAAIIAVWLSLNYKVFSSFSQSAADFGRELPDAGFFAIAGEKLNIFKKELKFGKMESLSRSLYEIYGLEQIENVKFSDKIMSLKNGLA